MFYLFGIIWCSMLNSRQSKYKAEESQNNNQFEYHNVLQDEQRTSQPFPYNSQFRTNTPQHYTSTENPNYLTNDHNKNSAEQHNDLRCVNINPQIFQNVSFNTKYRHLISPEIYTMTEEIRSLLNEYRDTKNIQPLVSYIMNLFHSAVDIDKLKMWFLQVCSKFINQNNPNYMVIMQAFNFRINNLANQIKHIRLQQIQQTEHSLFFDCAQTYLNTNNNAANALHYNSQPLFYFYNPESTLNSNRFQPATRCNPPLNPNTAFNTYNECTALRNHQHAHHMNPQYCNFNAHRRFCSNEQYAYDNHLFSGPLNIPECNLERKDCADENRTTYKTHDRNFPYSLSEDENTDLRNFANTPNSGIHSNDLNQTQRLYNENVNASNLN